MVKYPITIDVIEFNSRQNRVVDLVIHCPIVYHPRTAFLVLECSTFENIVVKGGIARDEQFLLLPQCFHIYSPYSLITIVLCFSEKVFYSFAESIEPGRHAWTWVETFYFQQIFFMFKDRSAEPLTSVGNAHDLSPGGRWFDPGLGLYFFRGFMIVIAIGSVLLSPLSIFSTKAE